MRHPRLLSDVRARAHPVYPADLLPGLRSALMLFCAGFYGANDCVHVADAGVPHVTAVDVDRERVDVMRRIYSPGWWFVVKDVYEYASWAEANEMTWDLVALDPPVAESSAAAPALLWTPLAERLVVHGMMRADVDARRLAVGAMPVDDWQVTRILDRNDRACWVVYERVPDEQERLS